MEIWIGGQFSADVADDARKLCNEFREQFAGDGSLPGLAELSCIAMIPTIMDPALGTFPDNARYSKREHTQYLSFNISHAEWVQSNHSSRAKLLVGAMLRHIEAIPEKRLGAEEKLRVLSAINEVGDRLTASERW